MEGRLPKVLQDPGNKIMRDCFDWLNRHLKKKFKKKIPTSGPDAPKPKPPPGYDPNLNVNAGAISGDQSWSR
jgi:hypothetical protein